MWWWTRHSSVVSALVLLVACAGDAADRNGALPGAGGVGASGSGAPTGDAGIRDPDDFGANAGIQEMEIPELTPGNACARDVFPAKPLPLDMYIMLDSTGSMGDDANVGDACMMGSGQDKWCFSINALDRFFNLPTSAGMGVALSFYNTSKVIPPNCMGLVYMNPKVPMGLLPDNTGPLRNAMNFEFPIATTDTEPAIRGLIGYTTGAKQPDRTMVGILVTDGSPNNCSEEPEFLGGLLEAHLNATGIKTFVIGMQGARYETLEIIAQGGGAPEHADCSKDPFAIAVGPTCHYYDVGDGNPDAFVEALKTIQEVAIGCRFQIPQPSEPGEMIDFDRVNIDYVYGDGTRQELFNVTDPAACVEWAWHYDNQDAPGEIQLCDASCNAIQADESGQLEVILGCETRGPE